MAHVIEDPRCRPATKPVEVYDATCVQCPYHAIAMTSGAASEALLHHLGYAHDGGRTPGRPPA